jgi:prepilin-type N-terminal cleavage/methylation domain-containing protein
MQNKNYNSNFHSGFTLVELLLVIGIIATLAVVVFVALDPAKRFADARDAKRTSDVETILSAVHQYVIDNKGAFPAGLTADEEWLLGTSGNYCVNNAKAGSGGCNANNNSCLDLTIPLARYLKTMPVDSQNGTAEITQYSIMRNSNGIVTVNACNSEGGVISASR